MSNNVTFEELILEFMPFSRQLLNWCKLHPEFQNALKVIYSERFISLGAIVTSYSPNYPNDEVIGVYAYDYKLKNPLFKQDFIVNIGKLDNEFILYTRNAKGSSTKYVKDINDFYATYGKGGYYLNSHHLTLEQLPQELRERGESAIKLAQKVQNGGYIKPDQKHVNKVYGEVMEEKKGVWANWKKLSKG